MIPEPSRQRIKSLARYLFIVGLALVTTTLLARQESSSREIDRKYDSGELMLVSLEKKSNNSSKADGHSVTLEHAKPNAKDGGSVEVSASQPWSDSGFSNGTSPFSYAFVIGGCDPAMPPTYQNYLFNIAIATKVLRELGSTADVSVLFQLSEKAESNALNQGDLDILHALGVYVYYIPKQSQGLESFYRTQLDKFRILGLTQYQRILFMDGDVLPLANLDYLFEMSVNGTLMENVVIQGIFEPANGGFFLLKPGYLHQVQAIISWREQTGVALGYPFFDFDQGWGHVLSPDDPWRSLRRIGTNWTFLAAFADQGLLYHFVKYARRSVSIIMRNGATENWGPVKERLQNGTTIETVKLLQTIEKAFVNQSGVKITEIPGRHKRHPVPFDSFFHFTGNTKPWMGGGPPKDCCVDPFACCSSEATKFTSARHYWYWQLSKLNRELSLGLNFSSHWQQSRTQRPPLGLYPIYKHVRDAQSDITVPLKRVFPPLRSR